MKKSKLKYEHLVKQTTRLLTALNRTALQNIPEKDIPRLAVTQAKILAFLKVTPKELRAQTAFDYQATVDWALAALEFMSEGDKLTFLEAVGRPLTNEEMIRFIFGK